MMSIITIPGEDSFLSPNLTVAENQDSFNITCTFNWQIGDHPIFFCINQRRETIDVSTMCNSSYNSCVKTVEGTSPFNVSCCGYGGENVSLYCSNIIRQEQQEQSLPIPEGSTTEPPSTTTGDPPTANITGDPPTANFTGDPPIANITGDPPTAKVTGDPLTAGYPPTANVYW